MRGQTSNARELKLYCLRESADELVERAERSQLGYREFLDLVLEDEAGVLEGRRYASHLKLSALPHHKTLDDFDAFFQPEPWARAAHPEARRRFPAPRSLAEPSRARPRRARRVGVALQSGRRGDRLACARPGSRAP